jgi:hypothetical protein
MKMTMAFRFQDGARGYLMVDQPLIPSDVSRPIAPQSIPTEVLYIDVSTDNGDGNYCGTLHLKRFLKHPKDGIAFLETSG